MTGLRTRHRSADDSPGLALWRTTNAWQREIRAALTPHDLTHVQYVLLASVTWMDRSEPVTQRDLAAHTGADVMMTSQVVRTLERKGLVTRDSHPRDRRAVVVAPTAEGAELAGRATVDVEAVDDAFFASLSSDRRTAFVAALRDLAGRPV
ncbi:MarR family winged helix-turn-helix transcriptional regulator [Williamsia deligens]|uniref:MarR family winged helix-turn-helix transcriptional regulator n=1 Tax=Williamsia deligens TaxID=321325 RepID=A0ABW3G8X4_9NOCA|nr:MarR family transcriptional regulator [Williamsia deligens]MCP2195802.1 DNA-binding transcriptional regulator, MarR family [Williamsia deligens]